jgi:GNAT superfamily N-acetyltransferase
VVRHGHLRQPRQGGAAPRARQVHLSRVVEVVRTYLALDAADGLRPARDADQPARLVRLDPCPVEEYRRLYRDVGAQWYWHDRLEWSDAELEAHLASPSVAVWELLVDDASAGYFELQRHGDGSVEIVYFGLVPARIGRGLGGVMLTAAVREAFAMGASRVWLHTCTLDSPNALPSYEARGFRPYRTQRLEVEIEGSTVVSERLLD